MGSFRLLLACAVLVAHFKPFGSAWLLDGWIAVQSFYVVSGFYMAMIISEKYNGVPNWKSVFWTGRILRLFPTYFLVLGISVALCLVNYVANNWAPNALPTVASTAVRNPLRTIEAENFGVLGILWLVITQTTLLGMDTWLSITWTESGELTWRLFYEPNKPSFGALFLPQAWSLSFELYFYMLAPFILHRKQLVVSLLVASFAARVVAYQAGLFAAPLDYRFFPFEIGMFLSGSCAYFVYKHLRDVGALRSKMSLPFWGVVLAVIGYCIAYPWLDWTRSAGFYVKQWHFLAFVPIAVPLLFHHTQNNRWDRYIGNLSYPVYISQFAVQLLVVMVGVPPGSQPIAIVVGSILAGVLLNEFQERVEVYRAERFKKSVVSFSAPIRT